MRLVLDRIEKNAQGLRIAVLECEDENVLIDENSMPSGLIEQLFVGAIIEATFESGKIVEAQILTEETKIKKSVMRSRLDALKKRKNNR